MDYEYLKLKEKLDTPDGKRLFERLEREYLEKYANTPMDALDYREFKLVYKTGNRSEFERKFFQSRRRLTLLQVLALGDDKYLDDLEDIIANICDKYSWVLPAHSHQKDGKFDYSFIDLYSAETAFYLSETFYVFGDKLSLDIRERIKYSLKTKVLDFFENRTFWWEKEEGTNWTSACACSVGIAYLYAFPERFVLVKDRILKNCEYYLNGLRSDGVCEEGLSYWWYGFGFTCFFLDLYKQKYGKLPDFVYSKKVERTLQYRMNGIIEGRQFPFADASSAVLEDYPIAELTIKKLFPEFVLPDYDFIGKAHSGVKALFIRLIDAIGRFENETCKVEKSAKQSTYLYEDSQIFIANKEKYLFLTKGGHNQEMHNHNDVGGFAFYVGGKRIIADLGAGEYTWEYFNDPVARYGEEIFCCGSRSHSVPIIDGDYQKFGRDKKAETLAVRESGIKFEIMSAYGIADESLTVDYECQDDGIRVKYAFKGKNRQITFRFVSDYEPKLVGDKVFIENVQILCSEKSETTYQKHIWKEHSGKDAVAYALDFATSPSEEREIEFEFLIKSERGE